MGTTRITAEPGAPFIDIVRTFDAPRELVYRAHTEPELLKRWLGPAAYDLTVDRFEVRDGGTWRYVSRDADGNEYGFHGVFHGQPSPDRIVQTFEFEGAPGHVALETLVLDEQDGRTTTRVHSVYGSVEARDAMIAGGMERGVNEGYDRLDAVLAQRLVPVG